MSVFAVIWTHEFAGSNTYDISTQRVVATVRFIRKRDGQCRSVRLVTDWNRGHQGSESYYEEINRYVQEDEDDHYVMSWECDYCVSTKDILVSRSYPAPPTEEGQGGELPSEQANNLSIVIQPSVPRRQHPLGVPLVGEQHDGLPMEVRILFMRWEAEYNWDDNNRCLDGCGLIGRVMPFAEGLATMFSVSQSTIT